MKLTIQTKNNGEIDVTDWIGQMKENARNKKNVFERTPICHRADGSFFWYQDDDVFYDIIDDGSIRGLEKFLTTPLK